MDVVGMMLQNSRNHTTQMYETCCWQWDENSNINWIDWFIESTVSTGQIENIKTHKHKHNRRVGGNEKKQVVNVHAWWKLLKWWYLLTKSIETIFSWMKVVMLLTLVYPWKLDETIYSELMEVWSWDYIIGIGLMSLLHYIPCACKANEWERFLTFFLAKTQRKDQRNKTSCLE